MFRHVLHLPTGPVGFQDYVHHIGARANAFIERTWSLIPPMAIRFFYRVTLEHFPDCRASNSYQPTLASFAAKLASAPNELQ